MPEPLGGKDEIQNQIRHFTETKTTIETQSQDLRNPTNSNTLDETEIVHLGKSFKMNVVCLFRLGRNLIKHCGTLEHANVLYH